MGTVPTPLDWIAADGTFITAAIGQAGVGDVLDFLLNPPGAQVRRSTAQSIVNSGSGSAIAFDTEDSDTDAMHSVNGTRLTCNTPGTYLISGMVPFDPNGTGSRDARIVKNATGVAIPGGRTILIPSGSVSITVPLAAIELPMIAGDFVELIAFQSSGGALNTTAANGVFPFFRASWVRP
jgi:hypothetical protein